MVVVVNSSSILFPACPWLPPPDPHMNHRCLSDLGQERGSHFYETCLKYGHYLWLQGLSARAILCLDRAFGADLTGAEPALDRHPLPYHAMKWFLHYNPEGNFIGNPRVHFQHYADRLGPPRQDQRKWRAWACWYLTCQTLPHLPPDPRHQVEEPTFQQIDQALQQFGHPRESSLWQDALAPPLS